MGGLLEWSFLLGDFFARFFVQAQKVTTMMNDTLNIQHSIWVLSTAFGASFVYVNI